MNRLARLFGAGFVHVFNAVLEQQKIGSANTIELQALTVIPFNNAFQLLSIRENHHHVRFALHLLRVVELLGIGLVGRRVLFDSRRTATGVFVIRRVTN